MKSILRSLDIFDIVVMTFFLLLSTGMMAGSGAIPSWSTFIAVNAGVFCAVPLAARFFSSRGGGWKPLHGYLLMLVIPLAFKQVYFIGPALHPSDIDQLLIAADRWIFGVDPTHVLAGLAHPLLTEILQIAYGSFYFLPIILAAELYRRKNANNARYVLFVTVLGFFLSYFGYVAGPAIGPRFTLHDFEQTDAELPGLLVTPALRALTNAGESIPPGTINPEKVVQRDCFPSGHTQMTLLVMILAFHFRARSRWVLAATGSLLIFATVYLRYHYAVDLLAGGVFAGITLIAAKYLWQWRGAPVMALRN